MNYFDKRGKIVVKKFVKTMRKRGHSRESIMKMINEIDMELCIPFLDKK